jgi:very-short-patch-repair endonuclease
VPESSDRSPRPQSLAAAVRELAERQHGVVSRYQLLEMGLTDRQIVRRIETEQLMVVRRGVYSLGHVPGNRLATWMSALLFAGPGSALSYRSAAALWGFRDWGGPVEVLSPVTGRRRTERRDPTHFTPPLVRKATNLSPSQVTLIQGIPVTTVPRTFVDLAGVLSESRLSTALNSASIKKLLDVDDLRRVVSESKGRRGIGTLRRLLARHHPLTVFTRSELEVRFLSLLRKARLPEPLVNVTIAFCEVDFYWPDYELVVELDGRRFHDTAVAFEGDRERTARLELSGRRVLRLTWDMVANQPDATTQKLRAYMRMALENRMDAERVAQIRAENQAWLHEQDQGL